MIAPNQYLSLRWFFLCLTVVPTVLVAIFTGIMISESLSTQFEERLINRSTALGEHLANSSEFSLKTNDFSELTKLACASLYASNEINEIEILNDRRAQLTSCPRLNKYSGEFFTTLVPIHGLKKTGSDDDTLLGYVRITTSKSLMQNELLHLLGTILGILVGAIFFALLFSYFLTRGLTVALVELSIASKSIASKNFKFKFTKILGGEFGILQKSFLEMTRTMENFTRQLENNVAARTKELESQKNLLTKALSDNKRLIAKSNTAIENERKAIALDIHDVYNTFILSILGTARRTKSSLNKINSDGQLDQPISDMAVIESSANHLYSLSRDLVANLRPEALDNLGLAPALEDLVNRQRKVDVSCKYNFETIGSVPKLDDDFNIALYRIVQESLSNVMKHSGATHCTVTLTTIRIDSSYRVLVRIEDNGFGFEMNNPRHGIGLIGMKERAWATSGTIEITSTPGSGTTILFSVDLPS